VRGKARKNHQRNNNKNNINNRTTLIRSRVFKKAQIAKKDHLRPK
jgi:hypothetical protein